MSHSPEPARERLDHLALANNTAFRYYELVLPQRELTGYEHLAAAHLAVTVASHLDEHLSSLAADGDIDTALAMMCAVASARATAAGHDRAAWACDDVVAALTDLLGGEVNG